MSDNSRCPDCGNTDPGQIKPVFRGSGEIIGYRCIACGFQYDVDPAETPQKRADVTSGWQPIETRPDTLQPCWIGHAPSRGMFAARPSSLVPGTWRTLWGDNLVPWQPTHWQKLPQPPGTATELRPPEDHPDTIPIRKISVREP